MDPDWEAQMHGNPADTAEARKATPKLHHRLLIVMIGAMMVLMLSVSPDSVIMWIALALGVLYLVLLDRLFRDLQDRLEAARRGGASQGYG
jgi:hypothetical protein